MTRQDQNQTYDQKKGSADLRAVVNDVEQRGPRDADGETISGQPGCGPSVTDYPGMPAPSGEDAQSTGSDA